jgi:hypothetical protein
LSLLSCSTCSLRRNTGRWVLLIKGHFYLA